MVNGANVAETGRRLNMGDISKKGHGIERRGPHGHGSMPQLSTHNKGGRVGHNKGGRAGRQIGGRANLLEEVGRLDAERMNPNRRAEKSRVIGELNRGYNKGGRVGLKKGGDGKWIQKVNKSIKARGTKGKCTPITKPGCTGRAKALAKTFKKMAKKRKAA